MLILQWLIQEVSGWTVVVMMCIMLFGKRFFCCLDSNSNLQKADPNCDHVHRKMLVAMHQKIEENSSVLSRKHLHKYRSGSRLKFFWLLEGNKSALVL